MCSEFRLEAWREDGRAGAGGRWGGRGGELELTLPFDLAYRRDCVSSRRSLRRCLTSPIGQPILFCDVITADIFTSFAKVIGDLWVSSCLVFGGHISASQLEGAGSGMGYWVVPLMTS